MLIKLKLKAQGSKYIDHSNVISAIKCQCKDKRSTAMRDAKRAEEVLFINGIPFGAIIIEE